MWLRSVPQYLRPWIQPKRFAVFEACVIGVVSALAAVLLKQGIGWLGSWRIYASHIWPAWWVLPSVGLVGGLLSGWLIERLAPEASGSGIPQVKAALAYVPMALDLRVAIVKMASTILALGAGLTLGRQGPTVQVGAALAAQLSRWIPTSPDYRRQLIAAGAAAGLAAGFNAPIAGVLFVVEELLQDVSELTLGTAILASFIGAVVSRLLGGQGLNLHVTPSQTSLSLHELPVFLLLGFLAGVLGTVFTQGIFLSLKINRQWLPVSLPWRLAGAGWLSGLILAMLPVTLRDNAGLQDFLVTGSATWQITALAFVVKFLLTLIAYGAGAPGGLFAPSLVLGSALGYLVNRGAEHLQIVLGMTPGLEMPLATSTTYALAGMGAFFSAVARGPITAIVIVFEITMDFNLVLPLMIGSVVAYLVAESLAHGSIYQRLLEWNGIQLETEAPLEGRLAELKAADIMQRRVETLSSQMTLDEALEAFSRSHHRGFPVVDDGRLVGIITQTDLANMSQRQLPGDTPLQAMMTPQPLTVSPKSALTQVLYLLNHHKISRLPVVERRKLVGIITRADIIRVESDQLSGKSHEVGPRPEPSYVVYQTQSPAVGKGRLLVPLYNPQTAETLLQLAAAIARDRQYELECLQVILVPRTLSPAETPVRTTASRRLLRQAARLGEDWHIPVHTQIRAAHDVAEAILETLKERHIDLILMGWKGNTLTPGRIFGTAVDTIIRQAACDVILVKLGTQVHSQPLVSQSPPTAISGTSSEEAWIVPYSLPSFDRWLVPLAGGPNAEQAVKLLPALVALSKKPEVRLCQVFNPSETEPDTTSLSHAAEFLKRRLKGRVVAGPVWSSSISEAVINLAEEGYYNVIALGATREGLLQQALKGNIPEAIAHNSDCTVILVRRALSA